MELTVNISEKLANSYVGDKVRIKQILLNLVSNAIKFTDAGSVTISVDKDTHHAGNLAFTVCDTGIGIPEDQQQKVFSKFAQGGIALDRKIGGTGLGLSISKSLAEAMGGSITLKSDVGKGTCFTLHIPLLNAAHYVAAHEGEALLGKNDVLLPHPVLIVEDTQTNVDVITTYLQQANIAYEVAYSGMSAIEKLRTTRYSVILMDLQMSGMDGFTTAQHMRNLPQDYAKDIPIIVVTAHAEESIRKKCMQANMPDFITKPIDNQLLLRTLKKFENIGSSANVS